MKHFLISPNFPNRSKLRGNCSFPQNFHTRKLDEITVFFVVLIVDLWSKKNRFLIHYVARETIDFPVSFFVAKRIHPYTKTYNPCFLKKKL